MVGEGISTVENTIVVYEVSRPKELTSELLSKIIDCAKTVYAGGQHVTERYYIRLINNYRAKIRYTLDTEGNVTGFIVTRNAKKNILPGAEVLKINLVVVRKENHKLGIYRELGFKAVDEAILKKLSGIRLITHNPRVELGLHKILQKFIAQGVLKGFTVLRDIILDPVRDYRDKPEVSGVREIDEAYFGKDGKKNYTYSININFAYVKQ